MVSIASVFLGTTLVSTNQPYVRSIVVISIHIRGMDKGYSCPFVSRMES